MQKTAFRVGHYVNEWCKKVLDSGRFNSKEYFCINPIAKNFIRKGSIPGYYNFPFKEHVEECSLKSNLDKTLSLKEYIDGRDKT